MGLCHTLKGCQATSFFFFENNNGNVPINIIIGKIMPDAIPHFRPNSSGVIERLFAYDAKRSEAVTLSDTIPVRYGPREHPMSPASARSENIAEPAPTNLDEDSESSPGHKRLTPSPQSAHPASDMTED